MRKRPVGGTHSNPKAISSTIGTIETARRHGTRAETSTRGGWGRSWRSDRRDGSRWMLLPNESPESGVGAHRARRAAIDPADELSSAKRPVTVRAAARRGTPWSGSIRERTTRRRCGSPSEFASLAERRPTGTSAEVRDPAYEETRRPEIAAQASREDPSRTTSFTVPPRSRRTLRMPSIGRRVKCRMRRAPMDAFHGMAGISALARRRADQAALRSRLTASWAFAGFQTASTKRAAARARPRNESTMARPTLAEARHRRRRGPGRR